MQFFFSLSLFCCQCDVSFKESGYCSSRVRLAVISFEIVCAFFFSLSPFFHSSFALMFSFFPLIFSNWFWLLPSLSDSARLFERHAMKYQSLNEESKRGAKRVNDIESSGGKPSYQTLFDIEHGWSIPCSFQSWLHSTQKIPMMHNASIGTIEKNIIRYVAFNCALNAKKKKLRALRLALAFWHIHIRFRMIWFYMDAHYFHIKKNTSEMVRG